LVAACVHYVILCDRCPTIGTVGATLLSCLYGALYHR